MSLSLKTSLAAELGWLCEDKNENSQCTDRGTLRKQADFHFSEDVAGGTDAVWVLKNTPLPAGGTHTHDLETLVREMFREYVTVRLAEVYTLFFVNHAPGETLRVGGAAAHAWSGFFGADEHFFHVPADGFFCISAAKNPWEVSSEKSLLKIQNPGTLDAVYDIALVGRKFSDDPETSSSGGSGSGGSGSDF